MGTRTNLSLILKKISFLPLICLLACHKPSIPTSSVKFIPAETSVEKIAMINSRGKLFRFTNRNKIDWLDNFHFDDSGGTLYVGSTDPTYNAAKNMIVYIYNGKLWVLDVASNRSNQIADQATYISGVSRDGNLILYVSSFDAREGMDAEDTGERYVYNAYDLKLKASKVIAIPQEYIGWLPNNNILLFRDKKLISYDLSSQKENILWQLAEDVGQIEILSSGNFVGTATGPSYSYSQIVFLDMNLKKMIPISDRGRFAQFQSPKTSPDEKLIVYKNCLSQFDCTSELYDFTTKTTRTIHSFAGIIRAFDWIDNQKIAVEMISKSNKTELFILNVTDGHILNSLNDVTPQ